MTAATTATTEVSASDLVEAKKSARAAVLAAREIRERWVLAADAAAVKVARQESLNESDLADPDVLVGAAQLAAAAREEERLARGAASAQDVLVLAAETAFVQTCLDVARDEAASAKCELQQHQARVARAVEGLRRLEGAPERPVIGWPTGLRSDELREVSDRAGKTVELLELLLEGGDPQDRMNHWLTFGAVVSPSPETLLPTSLGGASALVPFRDYVARRRAV